MTTRQLFVGIFLFALFALSAKAVTDPDFGWHLRTGEYIVATQTIPHQDVFSFTAAGAAWITHEWLVQVVMYLLYNVGGYGALIFFFALLATLAFWLVYLRCAGKPFIAAFVVLFAAIAAAPFWGTRPQTVSLFLTSAFLYVLDRYRREGQWKILLWLLPLMLIWVNSHGSFALGPFLILMYLMGGVIERFARWNADGAAPPRALPLFGSLLGCVALIVVNPNGFALYAYPFQTLVSGTIQTYIQEWQPPELFSQAILPFTLMLGITLAALAAARRRIDLVSILLLVGFLFASLRAARQISIWVLIAAPVLAVALTCLDDLFPIARLTRQGIERASRPQQILNAALLAVVGFAALLRAATVIQNQSAEAQRYFPVKAVEWIQRERQHGPIFNLYDWGGYLIWKLYPQEHVFIDGRSDLYGLTENRVVREYLATLNGDPNWRDALEEYKVRLVLIPPNTRLANLLQNETGWKQMYADEQAMIFIRR